MSSASGPRIQSSVKEFGIGLRAMIENNGDEVVSENVTGGQDEAGDTATDNSTPSVDTAAKATARGPRKIGSQRGPEFDQDLPNAAAEVPVDAESLFPAPPVKRISAELQAEIDQALDGLSLDDLMGGAATTSTAGTAIELDQRYDAKVIKCDRDSVFVTIAGQHEGVAALRQFEEPPVPGATLQVVPTRWLVDDNLYEVVVPGASVEVQDWSDLSDGVVVTARITGHNKGGLEAEVNKIRGFIPASQVSLFRIEDFESYVGQTLQCVVTECNPDRRNLVLSHRAMLEREREQSRAKLLSELEVG
ncbi:MAG: S1 RNA-binding domain-containing protein, partial [Planctomycetales bacterium]|nr:S1 RNA-binding domain-containing protein [Planctomycetales bacterium]